MSQETEGPELEPGGTVLSHLRGRVESVLSAIREPAAGETPTADEEELTQRHARAVIDLCLRIGETMLAAGGSAADVVATVLRLGEGYGLEGTQVDVTFTSITLSIRRGYDEDPISAMRVVKVRTTDYARQQAVYRLIEEILDPDIPIEPDEALRRLRVILFRPHPYRRWVVTLGKATLAAGVVVMYDASIVLVFVAALAAAAVDLLTARLSKWGISEFFSQIFAASLTTAVAAFMYWLSAMGMELPGANRPTVIVISGIIMLLSGIGLTSAARDAIDGYYVTASARILEVMMLTIGLAVGISVTLGISLQLGVPIRVGTSLGPDAGLLPGVIGSALIGVGFALTSYVHLRVIPVMAAVAGVVYACYYFLLPLTDQPGIVPALAGVVSGLLGYLVYRWIQVPEGAMTMAGVIGLIPGLAVYRALYSMMDLTFGVANGLPALISALATGLGLAAGTTIGGFFARRMFGFDRAARKASRRGREE